MKTFPIRFQAATGHRLLGRGTAQERIGLLFVLVLAAIWLAWMLWRVLELKAEEARVLTELKEARASISKTERAPKPGPSAAYPAESLRQMDAAIARLNVPWSDVLDVLERTATPHVALLALEPDARTGTVGLTLEAATLDEILKYVQALASDSAIDSVRLLQHDLRAQDPGQPVRMAVAIHPSPLRR